MNQPRVIPVSFVWGAAISACEKGRHWTAALQLLEDMASATVQPHVTSFNAVTGRWEASMFGEASVWGYPHRHGGTPIAGWVHGKSHRKTHISIISIISIYLYIYVFIYLYIYIYIKMDDAAGSPISGNLHLGWSEIVTCSLGKWWCFTSTLSFRDTLLVERTCILTFHWVGSKESGWSSQ